MLALRRVGPAAVLGGERPARRPSAEPLVAQPAAVTRRLHAAAGRVWNVMATPGAVRYLGAVLRGLDYYVTTGCDVIPNQFGRVWLFSYRLTRAAQAVHAGTV